MKLWQKETNVDKRIETFSIGRDRELDLYLAPYDITGTLAHITMLESVGLISKNEWAQLRAELKKIYQLATSGDFRIEEGIEDVHSQVEMMLTRALGDIGKKVHTGRSRNDQVLVDLKLYFLAEIRELTDGVKDLFHQLLELSETHKSILMPGYTHTQVAMPSSFGLWFGAFAESLVDDLIMLQAAWQVADQNPLGSAAGYGSSFPLDRTLTTKLLGFSTLSYNVVYAQVGRGKTEKILATALSSVASTLNKLATDICLFMNQNFGFITFPDRLTTGSSIMPHKKNPDVWELIRAKTNKTQALPMEISHIISNLITGYHRDFQLVKESMIPAIEDMKDILAISAYMLHHIEVRDDLVSDPVYDYLFSVEAVNREVLNGLPFRDAYKKIGMQIEKGEFVPERDLHHTHEGSIGNLCTEEIRRKMDKVLERFSFEQVTRAAEALWKD